MAFRLADPSKRISTATKLSTLRADQLLVQQGLAPTRSAAQRLIKAGAVLRCGTVLTKAGENLPLDTQLHVKDDAELRYVSRGGLKLEGALEHCSWDPAGWNCLDIGSSTGGFADCLLQREAAFVVGIDVGHGQLHPRLVADPRMVNLEGINARELTAGDLPPDSRKRVFHLAVIDVSFISLTLVLPAVIALLPQSAKILALVKPQFELGSKSLTRAGNARLTSDYDVLQSGMHACCTDAGAQVTHYFPSPITGQQGTREFFIAAHKP